MRAILADPGDGEIMSLYAKLVWELHHDKDKASCYFERAVQAAPGDRYNFRAEFLISLLRFSSCLKEVASALTQHALQIAHPF